MTKQIVEQAVRELEVLPEALVQEVLDFIGYLRTKYETGGDEAELTNKQNSDDLLETFGAWQDERSAEEIIEEIYESRTGSGPEYSL